VYTRSASSGRLEKRDWAETRGNCLRLILEKDVGLPSCQSEHGDLTLAEAREMINKKLTVVLEEVQG
jgi:hypothetical protein